VKDQVILELEQEKVSNSSDDEKEEKEEEKKEEEYDPYANNSNKEKKEEVKVEEVKKTVVKQSVHSIVQQECIYAIRALMNHKIGIQAFINSSRSVEMISRVLETENIKTKQQLFFLLSSCAVFSEDGFFLSLEIINHFKNAKKERFRFQTIIETIRKLDDKKEADTALLVAIMMFFNSLLNSVKDSRTKAILKREFSTLGLMGIIEAKMEDEENLEHHLFIQFTVFQDEMEANEDDDDLEEEENLDQEGLDNPMEILKQIRIQLSGTEGFPKFLQILRYFLTLTDNSTNNE
jgi:hypothetical protein